MSNNEELRRRIGTVKYKIHSAVNIGPFWGTPGEHVEREGYIADKKKQLATLEAELARLEAS